MKAGVLVFESGKKEEQEAEIIYCANSKNINFVFKGCVFSVQLSDRVDMLDAISFLSGQKRKVILSCKLEQNGRCYEGKRKLIWRKDNAAVSVGAKRFEFCHDITKNLLDTINSFKDK